MIQPPGIDNGAFVVTPDSVWYTRVLLLLSASAQTNRGSKSFDCALVSTLETYDDPEIGMVIIDIIVIIVVIVFMFVLLNFCHYCHYGGYCDY